MRKSIEQRLIDDARSIFIAALDGVDPANLLAGKPIEQMLDRDPGSFRRIRIVGAGKAGIPMASAAEKQLGAALTDGVVVVPHGYREHLPSQFSMPGKVEIVTAGHPIPDEGSVSAARRILRIASECSDDDLLLVLISGGGSALTAYFHDEISLPEAQEVVRLLLASGADIHEVNTVRKHLSRVGGGRLAKAAYPATVLSLLISDVVGDDPTVIASGPTVADPTTFADVRQVLTGYEVWDRLPGSVRDFVERGEADPALETPKPADDAFGRTVTRLLGTNTSALDAARDAATALGYSTHVMDRKLTGEAREVAAVEANEILQPGRSGPTCLLWGGETTVTLRGKGKGGRNQELALAAAMRMDGTRVSALLLAAGTDGIDGPTDAAGAWASPLTMERARHKSLVAHSFLDNNDAYTFFETVGGLLKTGPTHTNVMDVHIALILPA